MRFANFLLLPVLSLAVGSDVLAVFVGAAVPPRCAGPGLKRGFAVERPLPLGESSGVRAICGQAPSHNVLRLLAFSVRGLSSRLSIFSLKPDES